MSRRPEAVVRYLTRVGALEADPDVVEVPIRGRIRLEQTWYAFESTLVVHALVGFEWKARVHQGLVWFSGHDRYADGHGEMLWKLYGLLPVVRADDDDVAHSARGRAALEQVFLPSALSRSAVDWEQTEDGWYRASWVLDGEAVAIDLQLRPDGSLTGVRSRRWSDAEGTPWHFVTFGADVEGEVLVGGQRVPAKVDAGWFYDDDRWPEGRFFEGEVG